MKSAIEWWSVAAGLLLAACVLVEFAERASADETHEHAQLKESPLSDDARDHWSFTPLKRPQVPAVEDTAWPQTSIDRFVLARLEASGIHPQAEADPATLIRRVTIDLTGLPPTPAEVDAFVRDPTDDAYGRMVDRLLASPAFGQHQAQSWLDLARWAETDGFEHDKERPKAWQYRDWVIDAINQDLPYDEFVTLQLAGDEVRPGDAWARTATGFCLSGPDMPDINLQDERKADLLNELTGTVGAVFLGLQMGCARCHDHMYDPISQHDFYRLRAIFEPAVDLKGHTFNEGGKWKKPSYLYVRGDFRRPGPKVEPALVRVANIWDDKIQPPSTSDKTTRRRQQLAKWLTRDDHPLTTRVFVNRLWQQHFGRGLSDTPSDFGTMGNEPTHPALLDWLAVELVGSGWSAKHIHRLIVTSATYRQASRPNSSGDANWRKAMEADPRNRLLWCYPRHRLQGETIRDVMLASSMSLNYDHGGESVCPPLPKEVVQTLLRADHWKVSKDEADHYRRSVYIFARRNLRFPMFEAFDRPSATATCARRASSTTAPQSLLLLNSKFSLDAARRLAGHALAIAGENADGQVTAIYRAALSRHPSEVELAEAVAFLKDQQQRIAAENRPAAELAAPIPLGEGISANVGAALVDFCLTILNCNEFVNLE